ncbi:MAG: pilus biosynthesis protein PilM [Actinomycetia bacterium]|nr:pilus biosynthesis protein PilM [Actinomycetes bacterium]
MAAPTIVGLDIGSTSIRAVETGREKDRPLVVNAAHVPLPPGAVSGGVIADPHAVTTALTQLWSAAKFRSRRVVLGVTHHQVVVREMSVANVPARERQKSLPFQVRDVLPLPVERALLDFWPLEDPGQNRTVRGLLIAAPKEAVLGMVKAVEKAGLHVERVDLASFALLRAASRLDTQVEALVDIGYRTTSVVVHADGEPLIVRTIPRGGHDITDAIAKQLDVDLDEAEALKCELGLRPGPNQAVTMVIKEAVRPLISEIRSSFAYLTAGDRQTRVTRLAICGGGALLPGLDEALADDLQIEVTPADATVRVHTAAASHGSLDAFRPTAAVSIGLTLGAA